MKAKYCIGILIMLLLSFSSCRLRVTTQKATEIMDQEQ